MSINSTASSSQQPNASATLQHSASQSAFSQPVNTIPHPPNAPLVEPPLLTKLAPTLNELFRLLIEHRPADPLLYCAQFFGTRASAEAAAIPAAASSTPSTTTPSSTTPAAPAPAPALPVAENVPSAPLPLLLPNLPAARRNHGAALDAFVSHFFALNPVADPLTGELGLSAAEFAKILDKACIQFPTEVTAAMIKVFANPARDFIAFREFLFGVNACLTFGDFLARLEYLFGSCPQDREERVARPLVDQIIVSVQSQFDPAQIPSSAQLQDTLQRCIVAVGSTSTPDRICFRDFALALFRTTALPIELPLTATAKPIVAPAHVVTAVPGSWKSSTLSDLPLAPEPATAVAAAPLKPVYGPSSADHDPTIMLASMLKPAQTGVSTIDLSALLTSLTSYESARGSTPASTRPAK